MKTSSIAHLLKTPVPCGVALLIAHSVLFGQQPVQPLTAAPSPATLEHGLRHLKELVSVANDAAPDPDSKKKLGLQVGA
jgi:hypothetical protein